MWYFDNHTMHIGAGGLSTRGSGSGMTFGNGYLTSLQGVINVTQYGSNSLNLRVGIRDNGNIQVGLNIVFKAKGEVSLGGGLSNTFSGVVNIQGSHTLFLDKEDGAVAISGHMNVRDGAKVISRRSGQIAKHVRVTLESSGTHVSQLVLESWVRESFRELNVDGNGIAEFNGSSKLIIDEINVGSGDLLKVVGWEYQKDLFLVRKTSTHVKDALNRIVFQGQSKPVHLEDYNKDYWELTTAPEPATYGAIFGALGLGIAIYCKRRPSEPPR